MGHRPGEGLGRTGEGIVEPIKESVQRGRVGLGAEGVKELLAEEVKWEEEEVGAVIIRHFCNICTFFSKYNTVCMLFISYKYCHT